MTLVHSLKWSFFSELAAKVVQPVVFLILTRFLAPEDFGVMTAAMMVIAFSQIFWEAGMGKALIQRQTEVEAAANTVFWLNLAIGLAIAGSLYLFSHPLAMFLFEEERVSPVIQIMSLHVLFGAASSVQTALLQKEMEFRKLFIVRLVTVSVPGVASIPLALHGWGYWALVAGALAGQFLQVLVLWWINPWRPTLKNIRSVTIQMSKFGGWVTLTGLLSWFYIWADSLVVGKFLGLVDLGLYRVGQQFTGILFSLVFAPVIPVIYSYFSLHQSNKVKLRLETQQAIELGIWIALPIGIFLFAHRHHVERTLFGPEWAGLAMIIGLMSLREALASVTFMNGVVYRALGKPQYETIVLAVSLLFYIPVYWYLAQINLTAFLLGRVCLVLLSMLAHLYLLYLFIKVDIFRILKLFITVFCVSGAVLLSIEYTINIITDNIIAQILLALTISLLTMALIFYFLEKNGLYKLLHSHVNKKKNILPRHQ